MSPRADAAATTGTFAELTPEHRERLLALARDVTLPGAARIFEEGEDADRFWLLRGGVVALDVQLPGPGRVVVETIGAGGLLGWSWLFHPRRWHLGAEALETVRAWEFDADAVRALCAADPALGLPLVTAVAATIGERLRATRTRLLDLYGPPQGSAPPP
ncbi:cyclic nucleotide-binding domain-containing protein [Streptomyces sp. JJ38]|uniref:Crp/Fnr family transcriptional regulator n=1 Tax=Streptomyces sp. JJ38 TaxID=2738128 RepID=UPI0027E02E45|nr:cyclic nucleotide-binding domain-containing protein [Streptomyces sp. JJ38]